MMDKRESGGPPPELPGGEGGQEFGRSPDADRVFHLECRLEQLQAALDDARAEADRARTRLADVAAREAEQACRHALLHEDLAEAREDVLALHRRLEHSEALRAELEGHLFESGATSDVAELVRLRRELLAERQRSTRQERTLAHLRGRVEELVASRETLRTRIAEWQRLVRAGDPEAIDLAEFIAELRRDVLELEHLAFAGERREARLREQLDRAVGGPEGAPRVAVSGVPVAAGEPAARAAAAPVEDAVDRHTTGEAPPEAADAVLADAVLADAPAEATPVDVPAEPTPESTPGATPAAPASGGEGPGAPSDPGPSAGDELVAQLSAAVDPEAQAALLLRLGRTGEPDACFAIRPWAAAPEPLVRAAAYEALGRLFERDPGRLEPHLRWGLADADPRVRRRVVLAAATARGVALRPLLEPLRADPDGQVRRVVHEVLRRTPAGPQAEPAAAPSAADERPAPVASGAGR